MNHNTKTEQHAGYKQIKEHSLNHKRFKAFEVHNLIDQLPETFFKVEMCGQSLQNQNIYRIKFGNGATKVALWTQMHGNEPTATAAIFDLFNFLQSDAAVETYKFWAEKLEILIIPLVNPDGCNLYQRRNAAEIDINRDAVALSTPEAQLLMHELTSFAPKFGFNLHDQETYYTVSNTEKPATISFLAPSYNVHRETDAKRLRSMQVISSMNQALQPLIPNCVAKYSDEFYPSAFGDNLQKFGISTILIESGGYYNDPEKQVAREMNFVALLAGLNAIASETYLSEKKETYDAIPENGKLLFDLLIKNATYLGCRTDIGIKRFEQNAENEKGFIYNGIIEDLGDLRRFFGYETFDASGYEISAETPVKFGGKANFDLKNGISVLKIENGFIR